MSVQGKSLKIEAYLFGWRADLAYSTPIFQGSEMKILKKDNTITKGKCINSDLIFPHANIKGFL